VAGVFNLFEHIYRPEDEGLYADEMGENYLRTNDGTARTEQGRTTYYRIYWRTYQISDHSPMWIQLKADFGEDFLTQKDPIES
jgi:hypothetical protein